jgi:hypothetical protein
VCRKFSCDVFGLFISTSWKQPDSLQENKYVDRRFSSIHFGLPGGVSSSRHDKDTPLGLIFGAVCSSCDFAIDLPLAPVFGAAMKKWPVSGSEGRAGAVPKEA